METEKIIQFKNSISSKAFHIYCLLLLTSFGSQMGMSQISTQVIVFEGAQLITGNDEPPIEEGIIIIGEDRILAIGRKEDVFVPAGAMTIDATGKTIMPAIIDTHKHPSDRKDLLITQLEELASYGVGTVMSLGLDNNEVVYGFRKT